MVFNCIGFLNKTLLRIGKHFDEPEPVAYFKNGEYAALAEAEFNHFKIITEIEV